MEPIYRSDPDGEPDYDGEEYTEDEAYRMLQEDRWYDFVNESYNI